MSSTSQALNRLDSAFREVDEYTAPISRHVALRIYSDTRPHNGKIASLQKGLILVHNEAETMGEGTGFGVPIAMYSRETYFSGLSRVCIRKHSDTTIVQKDFVMDRVARNKFRSFRIENRKTRAALRYAAELYQKNEHLRLLFLKKLPLKMGYGTIFVRTAPMGTVTVTFTIEKGLVGVKADFGQLRNRGMRKLFMFNEQGSLHFRRYLDSEGNELLDGKIGSWNPAEAEWACLTDARGRLGFRLRQVPGGLLRRGREFLGGSLDWVGLDYEISPSKRVFEYGIEIVARPET